MGHPVQTFLSIFGIAIGIAVSSGIDLANKSALNAFKYSMKTITGDAVGHIVSPNMKIEAGRYFKLRSLGFRKISPVIEASVKAGNRTYILFGTDPFSFSGLSKRFSDIDYLKGKDISSLISEPGSVIISEAAAESLKLNPGDNFLLDTGKKTKKVKLYGIIKKTPNTLSYDHIIITDISTAQEITENYDFISRIDIFDKETFGKAGGFAGKDLSIIKSSSRSETTEQMVEAFQINLSALSLLALVVGLYLVYNTMTFSVVRRQTTTGIYRAVGVYKREIFFVIILEALFLGLPGTIAGLLFGFLLGKGLIFLVSRTLNDLYFAMTVNSVSLSYTIIIKGFLLGTVASAAAGIKPAFEAVNLPVAFSLKRSFQESSLRKKLPLFALAGIIMLIITILIILIDTKNIIIGYASFVPLITGFTLLAPFMIIGIVKSFIFFPQDFLL